jgi:hypothetical protein
MENDTGVVFCFVGGGSEFRRIERLAREQGRSSLVCLPYQPISQLAASLSAADLHVVVMGDGFQGIVHPCKIYNILAVGAPVLYIGPPASHVADICEREPRLASFCAQHGDVNTVVTHIRSAMGISNRERTASLLALEYSQSTLVPQMIAALERANTTNEAGGDRVYRRNLLQL